MSKFKKIFISAVFVLMGGLVLGLANLAKAQVNNSLPDLIVENIYYHNDLPVGQDTITYNICNRGEVDFKQGSHFSGNYFQERITVSTGKIINNTRTGINLSAGECSSDESDDNKYYLDNLGIEQDGAYIITIELDTNNEVEELNEVNNEATYNFTVSHFPLPDFIVKDIVIKNDDINKVPYIFVTFKNIGNNAAAKDIKVKVTDLDSGQVYSQSVGGGDFQSGFEYEMQMNSKLILNNNSVYHLRALVDSENVYQESNENNNELTKEIKYGQSNQSPVIIGTSGPTSLKINENGVWAVTANDPDGGYLIYSADWGDKTTTTNPQKATGTKSFNHPYAQSGTYTIIFTVTDEQGVIAKSTLSVKVSESTTKTPLILSFSVSMIDTDSAFLFWETDVPTSGVIYLTPTGIPTYIYGNPTDYTTSASVKLEGLMKSTYYSVYIKTTAKEGTGQIEERTATSKTLGFTTLPLLTNNSPTIHNVSGPSSLKFGETGNWKIEAIDSDSYYLTYNADWGDESIQAGKSSKSLTFNSIQSAILSHTYYKNGNYTVIFKVTDDSGASAKSTLSVEVNTKDPSITEIKNKAKLLHTDKYDELRAEIKELRNLVKEQDTKIKYLTKLIAGAQNLTTKIEDRLNNFITYGVDENTKKLGAGERAAVMYSYKNAFNKLPQTDIELEDAIKIANGRWPSEKNANAETKAKKEFKKIYLRDADMNISADNAAVTVMSYGLRQKAENRNLNSEKAGINIFKSIYGQAPQTTEDWNILQAITYSGASR